MMLKKRRWGVQIISVKRGNLSMDVTPKDILRVGSSNIRQKYVEYKKSKGKNVNKLLLKLSNMSINTKLV